MITRQDMNKIGDPEFRSQSYLSDKELSDTIEAYQLVIAFLRAREDAGIVVTTLRHELSTFEGFQQARKRC